MHSLHHKTVWASSTGPTPKPFRGTWDVHSLIFSPSGVRRNETLSHQSAAWSALRNALGFTRRDRPINTIEGIIRVDGVDRLCKLSFCGSSSIFGIRHLKGWTTSLCLDAPPDRTSRKSESLVGSEKKIKLLAHLSLPYDYCPVIIHHKVYWTQLLLEVRRQNCVKIMFFYILIFANIFFLQIFFLQKKIFRKKKYVRRFLEGEVTSQIMRYDCVACTYQHIGMMHTLCAQSFLSL